MAIERWNPDKHRDLVVGWVRARGMGDSLGEERVLPHTGFVVDGIVVGFLYQTDSGLAFMGSFMSDPASSKDDRHRAVCSLIKMLRQEAAGLGFIAIAATPSVDALIAKFEGQGFTLVRGCAYAIQRIGGG